MASHIIVSGITIEVIKKNIKNTHLAVYPPDGRVRIAAPLSLTDDAIRLFVVAKLQWIKRQQRQFAGQDRLSPRSHINRESHYFLGHRYLLNVIIHDAAPKVVIRNKTFMDLYLKEDSGPALRQIIMNEWYRCQLKLVIPELVAKWEKIMDVRAGEVKIKLMKTKWGSCNAEERRIWLNLELAKKPLNCIEYLIVHELIHFQERHHNENFTNLMTHYLPQWKRLRTELNQFPLSHANWKY